MAKRLTITWVIVAAAFLAAAPARATIGSVISSFPINPLNARYGIYRESTYVYLSQNDNNRNYLRKLTTTGSFVSSVRLLGSDLYPLYGGSRTHLGSGYVALCDNAEDRLRIFSITVGGRP
jgi:hypothetical protein